jgi:hypothetical protein
VGGQDGHGEQVQESQRLIPWLAQCDEALQMAVSVLDCRLVSIWLASAGRFVCNLSCIEKEVSNANIWVFDYCCFSFDSHFKRIFWLAFTILPEGLN